MKNILVVFVAMLLAALYIPAQSVAAEKVGKITAVKGDVRVLHDGTDTSVKAKMGDDIFVKDLIDTGSDGRLKLKMVDTSILSLGSNTKMVVREYAVDDKSKKRTSILGLLKGKLRTLVQKAYKAVGSKFEVHTPTAVAGVRSTETGYTVSDNGTTKVFAIAGTTYVISVNGTSVDISDGNGAVLASGQDPSVFEMSDSEMSEFLSEMFDIGDSDDGDGDGEGEGEDGDQGEEGDQGDDDNSDTIPGGGGGGGAPPTSPNTPGGTQPAY